MLSTIYSILVLKNSNLFRHKSVKLFESLSHSRNRLLAYGAVSKLHLYHFGIKAELSAGGEGIFRSIHQGI